MASRKHSIRKLGGHQLAPILLKPIIDGPEGVYLGKITKGDIAEQKDIKFAHLLAHLDHGIGYLDDDYSHEELMYRTLRAIAEEYVPGFAVVYRKPSGRPAKWNMYRRAELLEIFVEFCKDNNRLSGRVRYSAFSKAESRFQGTKPKTLENQISKARGERKYNEGNNILEYTKYVKMLRKGIKFRKEKNLPVYY